MAMESSVEIISHLKQHRKEAGMTQEELAEKLGVTRQTVLAIEQGKYQPSLYLAYKAAKLFKTSIEQLFRFQ